MKTQHYLTILFTFFLIIVHGQDTLKHKINNIIDDWHNAASKADFNAYFNLMTEDAVFIGTDASENWQLEEFKTFCKPYFEKGKAWSFKALQRNVYLNKSENLAWFDELLDTQMEICRGSGIMELTNDGWKVKHYVLSITIPNPDVKQVVRIKQEADSIYKKKLLNKTQ